MVESVETLVIKKTITRMMKAMVDAQIDDVFFECVKTMNTNKHSRRFVRNSLVQYSRVFHAIWNNDVAKMQHYCGNYVSFIIDQGEEYVLALFKQPYIDNGNKNL